MNSRNIFWAISSFFRGGLHCQDFLDKHRGKAASEIIQPVTSIQVIICLFLTSVHAPKSSYYTTCFYGGWRSVGKSQAEHSIKNP